jgi:putative Holliday junction resolvase
MHLAIDLWDKRCGIAVEVWWIVFPKGIILRPKLVNDLKKLITEYNISIIIVWLPYDLYGKELRQLEKTKNFMEKLKNIFPKLKIIWEDERFTSFAADQIVHEMWAQKWWKRDDISAALILESYLEKQ